MLYLSGAPRADLPSRGIGYMLTPQMGNTPDLASAWWAGDNGCFAHPERFDLDKFLAWLDARPRHSCLFACAPDVVGDAAATWERSKDVLPQLRALGFQAAFVAQDGIEDTVIQWDAFDVLFIGGSTAWKMSEGTVELVREAKRQGKWVHIGRVNSYKRLRIFADAGADSADGTYLAFGPDKNLPKLLGWLEDINGVATYARPPQELVMATIITTPVHMRDTRRPLGFYPGEAQPSQVPVICELDIIPRHGSRFTEDSAQVTCAGCLERIEASK